MHYASFFIHMGWWIGREKEIWDFYECLNLCMCLCRFRFRFHQNSIHFRIFFFLNQWHYFVRKYYFFQFPLCQSHHSFSSTPVNPSTSATILNESKYLDLLVLTLSIFSVMRTRTHAVVVNTHKNVTNFSITINAYMLVCDETLIILIRSWIEKKKI